MEILIDFIFNTIECDRTTWLARWKVDRSTPQSVRTLSVDRALQTQSRPVLNHFTLPSPGDSYHFVLCTTIQQKHSPHNEITCTLYRVIIAHPHVPFNILLWIKTVWFECKLSCISDVYSAWMWSAVHNLKSVYPFYPNYSTFSIDKVKWTNKWCDKQCICTPV